MKSKLKVDTYAEKEAAVLLSKATGRQLQIQKLSNLVQNYGATFFLTWELEVSTNIQDEIRRQLVICSNLL